MTDRLPERIPGPGALLLRRWVTGDAEILGEAVSESVEHLRPWMPWITQEPMTLAARRELIAGWERDWLAGGDVILGIFVDGVVAGGCGLHRRIGPGGLEIGYWTRVCFLRRGIAREAARLLTEAALGLPEITRVEIHQDQANELSARIPQALGFELVRSVARAPEAPGEVGLMCEWQTTRETWA